MRVLILGGGGMLGHKLGQVYKERFETWVTLRGSFEAYERFKLFDRERVIEGVDVFDFETVRQAFKVSRPEVVINAVGVIKQLPTAKDPIVALTINSLFPHQLAALCRESGARLITLSTDCVFNGRRGMYTEMDVADAEDLYGRTKFLGEATGENALTLRTSIIGRELASSHSLVEWFLSQRGGKVKGFTKAIYTGFPTIVMAEIIADLIERHATLSGLYHVSSEPINKYDLLKLIREAYRVEIEIEPDAEFQIDRSLDSKRFREATDFAPPAWPQMIKRMAEDPTPYDEWRLESVS
ncbi:MAG: SDR family oxidoreductase [Acidobacteria bacterium]|nr:SDR family oxidoreductase [Acidobacteriota bacterium]